LSWPDHLGTTVLVPMPIEGLLETRATVVEVLHTVAIEIGSLIGTAIVIIEAIGCLAHEGAIILGIGNTVLICVDHRAAIATV
tara:strand:- start:897 stop:1145 length:249 start_codon:yes stop_codon:yes gene_type:complete